jgi:hypothetical protein
MQAQVVHQRKQTLPWIPMLVAALLVAATAIGIQAALRDNGAVTAPSITSVEGSGVRDMGPHGAARIPSGEDKAVSLQKAGMVDAGYTNVSGIQVDTSGTHPRTKFGGSSEDGDFALRIHRIGLERRG